VPDPFSTSRTSPVPAPMPAPVAVPAAAKPAPAADSARALDAIFDELRGLREGQGEILDLLREPAAPRRGGGSAYEPLGAFGGDDARPAPPPPPGAVRSRRRKTVLLIDDDPQALAEAVAALEHAEVPVRSVADGSAGIAAIAEEKPDVIVMELGIKGAMAGKDVINMIKATMEWVDVPILLYTRVPIESQREARQMHGADEYVLKGSGSPEALVGRVIALFRKG
ncbi:MAG TPA: response regulator, partial [Vicinamibacteria bacterium]|nr:response regulator [Vicinamibacteria bacterium]